MNYVEKEIRNSFIWDSCINSFSWAFDVYLYFIVGEVEVGGLRV